jgi:hypothetical protein
MFTVVALIEVGKAIQASHSMKLYRYRGTYTARQNEETYKVPVILNCYYELKPGDTLVVSGELMFESKEGGGFSLVIRVNKTLRFRSGDSSQGEKAKAERPKEEKSGKGGRGKAAVAPEPQEEEDEDEDDVVF